MSFNATFNDFVNENDLAFDFLNRAFIPGVRRRIFASYSVYVTVFVLSVLNDIETKSMIEIIKNNIIHVIKNIIIRVSLTLFLFVVCMFVIDYHDKFAMIEIFQNNVDKFIIIVLILNASISFEKSFKDNVISVIEVIISIVVITCICFCGEFTVKVMLYGYK